MPDYSAPRGRFAVSRIARGTAALTAALLFSATGCREPVTAPRSMESGANREISSGEIGAGRRQLFFLLRDQESGAFQGSFDASLSPEVTVCLWVDDACQATTLDPVTLGSTGAASLRVNPNRQRYTFNWRTRTASLQADATYRMMVRVGGFQLGYLDIATGKNKLDLSKIDRREFLPLRVGAPVEVAFRIEQGPAIPDGIPGRYESDPDACADGCLLHSTPTNYFSAVWGGVRLGDLGGYGEAVLGFTATYDDPNPPVAPALPPGSIPIDAVGNWSWRYDDQGDVEIWVDGMEWGHWAGSDRDAILVPLYSPFNVFYSALHRMPEFLPTP
jgi:hypothetical protein